MNTYAHISHFYWAGRVAEAGYGPGSQWLWAPLWCPLDRGIFFVNTGTKCGFIWHKTLFFFWWPSTYMVAHPCAHPELQLNAVKIDVRIGNKTIYPAEMLWGLNMIMYRKDCVSPNGPREIQFSSQGQPVSFKAKPCSCPIGPDGQYQVSHDWPPGSGQLGLQPPPPCQQGTWESSSVVESDLAISELLLPGSRTPRKREHSHPL